MKYTVEHARPLEARFSTKSWPLLLDDTLDDCEKMFTAAQGHIVKTSKERFADTVLMALLCHHDRPLLLVNMTSAGEQQYYALALIKALFRHLPNDWVVVLLYDVACQLERSMRKVCTCCHRGPSTESDLSTASYLSISIDSCLQFQYFMHSVISGHVNLYTICESVKVMGYQMGRAANDSGVR